MKRLLEVLLVIALVSGLAVLGGVLVLVFGGPPVAQAVVERLVGNWSGREFEVAGEFEVEWGRVVDVTATQVRFSNAEWSSEPDMASAKRARLRLDLWSLVEGPIFIENIELDETRLRLERTADYQANWDFVFGEPGEDTGESDGGGPVVVIQNIDVNESQLVLTGPNLDRPLVINIDDLQQRLRDDGLLDSKLRGDVNDLELELDGDIGPLDNLISAEDAYFELFGRLDETLLRTTATIDDLTGPRQPDLELQLKGPDVGSLFEQLGLGRPGEGSFELTLDLEPDGETNQILIDGRANRLLIDVSGEIRELQEFDGIDVDAKISGPHLGRVLRLFDLKGPDDPFSLTARVQRNGKSLRVAEAILDIADARFNLQGSLSAFPTLDNAEVRLDVRGNDVEKLRSLLQVPGFAQGPFEITGTLGVNPQGVEELQVSARTNLGRARVSGTLGDPETFVGTELAVDVQGDNLATVGAAVNMPTLPSDFFRLSGKVSFNVENRVELTETVVTVGDDRIELSGQVGLEPFLSDTNVSLSASGNDLAQVLEIGGIERGTPPEPYTVKGGLRIDGDRLRLDGINASFQDAQIRADGEVRIEDAGVGADLRLSASGPNLKKLLAATPLYEQTRPGQFDVETRLKLTPAGFEAQGFRGNFARGNVRGDALVTRDEDFIGSRVTFSIDGPNLADLIEGDETFTPPEGPFEIEGTVERLDDAIKLTGVAIEYGRTRNSLDGTFTLPFGSGGELDLDWRGPDASVLPTLPGLAIDPLPFVIDLTADWEDGRWNIETADFALGDATANLSGTVNLISPEESTADMRLTASIPSLAKLGTYDGRRPLDQILQLYAEFDDDSKRIDVRELRVQLGESDIEGEVRLKLGDIPDLEIDLRARRLVNPRLFESLPVEEIDEVKEEAVESDRLIPDLALPLEQLRKQNVRLRLAADELKFRTSWKEFRLGASLQDGNLQIGQFNAEGESGNLSAQLELRQAGDSADIELEIDYQDLTTGLFADDQASLSALPEISGHHEFRSRGTTVRELAANLNGNGWLKSTDGQIPNNSVGRLFLGDFALELFSTVNPFAREEPFTAVVCVAIPHRIENGRLRTEPGFVLQTDKLNVATRGTINLQNERIDLGFQSQPRKGLGVSASQLINPFLRVGGTLKNPGITLDPTGTLVTGGAAVVTAGLSLFAKGAWNSIFRQKDPCGRAMENYEEAMAKAEEAN